MCILDGNAYDAKCLEAGVERDDDLDTCSLLLNNKSTPLLQPGGSGSHTNDHKVVVQLAVRVSFPCSFLRLVLLHLLLLHLPRPSCCALPCIFSPTGCRSFDLQGHSRRDE